MLFCSPDEHEFGLGRLRGVFMLRNTRLRRSDPMGGLSGF